MMVTRRFLWVFLIAITALAGCRAVDPSTETTSDQVPVTMVPLATEIIPTEEQESPSSRSSDANTNPDEGPALSPLATPATESDPLLSPLNDLLPDSPLATPTQMPSPTPTAVLDRGASTELVVLQTNDTWGYYDPCG